MKYWIPITKKREPLAQHVSDEAGNSKQVPMFDCREAVEDRYTELAEIEIRMVRRFGIRELREGE